ncbi:hypothetical protein ACIQI7_34635 [Kitasatospora sp. NPDC092039]|uniref:hypothetical protein n=1 Tax=Kitasatospora sp. NPDC092039 TaxID=3364086 RepID=UPI0038119A63
MPYETGATVRLTREVQVTEKGTAGLPGPLFLGEGLMGIVTGSAQEASTAASEHVALFDEQVRGFQFDASASYLINDLRQKVIRASGGGAGSGTQTLYRVRFENGFVLDGLEEGWLARV